MIYGVQITGVTEDLPLTPLLYVLDFAELVRRRNQSPWVCTHKRNKRSRPHRNQKNLAFAFYISVVKSIGYRLLVYVVVHPYKPVDMISYWRITNHVHLFVFFKRRWDRSDTWGIISNMSSIGIGLLTVRVLLSSRMPGSWAVLYNSTSACMALSSCLYTIYLLTCHSHQQGNTVKRLDKLILCWDPRLLADM